VFSLVLEAVVRMYLVWFTGVQVRKPTFKEAPNNLFCVNRLNWAKFVLRQPGFVEAHRLSPEP